MRGQAPKKDWKDRAEYDLYDAAAKQTDNTKKLELLNTWKAKYPTTDFNMERLGLYLLTYQALNQPDRVLETASEINRRGPEELAGGLPHDCRRHQARQAYAAAIGHRREGGQELDRQPGRVEARGRVRCGLGQGADPTFCRWGT